MVTNILHQDNGQNDDSSSQEGTGTHADRCATQSVAKWTAASAPSDHTYVHMLDICAQHGRFDDGIWYYYSYLVDLELHRVMWDDLAFFVERFVDLYRCQPTHEEMRPTIGISLARDSTHFPQVRGEFVRVDFASIVSDDNNGFGQVEDHVSKLCPTDYLLFAQWFVLVFCKVKPVHLQHNNMTYRSWAAYHARSGRCSFSLPCRRSSRQQIRSTNSATTPRPQRHCQGRKT